MCNKTRNSSWDIRCRGPYRFKRRTVTFCKLLLAERFALRNSQTSSNEIVVFPTQTRLHSIYDMIKNAK